MVCGCESKDFTPCGHGVPAACCGELWGTEGSVSVSSMMTMCSLQQLLYSPRKSLFFLSFFKIFNCFFWQTLKLQALNAVIF